MNNRATERVGDERFRAMNDPSPVRLGQVEISGPLGRSQTEFDSG